MKGRVVKRSKDSWTLIYDAPRVDGKRQQRSKTVRGNKKKAEAELARIIHEIETGQYAEPTKQTVQQYLEYWLETAKRGRVKPNTFAAYQGWIRRHVNPHLGHRLLPDLETHHLEALYAGLLRQGLSTTSVHFVHVVLYGALRQAVRWKMLPSNPADMDHPPQAKNAKPNPFTLEQTLKLIKGAEGHPLHGPIVVMVTQGLRPGEALGLMWEDINFREGTLAVRRTVARDPNGGLCFQGPKSDASEGLLLLTEQARAVLMEARQKCPVGCELVFPAPRGGLRWPQPLHRAWRRLLLREGIPHRRLHDLRHTCAALLFMKKTPVKVVQERLRHKRASTTLDIYGHLIPGMQEEAGKTLDDLLRPSAIDLSKPHLQRACDQNVSRRVRIRRF